MALTFLPSLSALDILALHPTLLHKTVPHEIRAVRSSIVNLLFGKMEKKINFLKDPF